tara:strand:- start:1922 stop:2089 length:168 start_codon:yes stop_codon:yes gene_type:complete
MKFWQHNCKEAGHTSVLHGEPCNWCDITEQDIEVAEYFNNANDNDITINPEEQVT